MIIQREFYCVAWVNTPPLGAQYLSLIPRPLAAERLHWVDFTNSGSLFDHGQDISTGSLKLK